MEGIYNRKKVRVAAYLRVSTDREEQRKSLENQRAAFEKLSALREGWSLVKIYADEGITGTIAKRRPRFMEMIDDCKRGDIDYIVTKSISRFARNTRECLKYVRILKEMGVFVLFEDNGLDTSDATSEFILTILAAVAQEESRSISENVKWSYRKRFEAGQMKWSGAYGYRCLEGRMVICKKEAEIVREIFDMYCGKMSLRQVAYELNVRGISSPRGKLWQGKTVRDIIINEKYAGDIMLQKYVTVDHLTHKKLLNDGSLAPIYCIRNHHEAIVERDQFELAGSLLRKRRSTGEER